MGSCVWCLTKLLLFCLFITFMPGIPPNAEFKEFNVVRPRSLHVDFLEKRQLDKAERLLEGEIIGPEAFAVYNGAIFTGIHGGWVVEVSEGKLKPVVKFGENCDDIIEESKCGRPLGMEFDKAGNLYVADAYYGIFQYDLSSKRKTLLVDVGQEIEGKNSTFVNDLTVSKDGIVYFTVSTTTFPLYDAVYAMLAPGDGRVVQYDPKTKKATVLADGLLLPNGIALSANEDFLVFSESSGARVMRYNLKGANKGTVQVFAEGLPGLPDNIRVDGHGGFFVALVVPADESNPALPVVLGPFPNIRRFLARVMYLLELPFVQINNLYPNYFCQRAAHMIGHFSGTQLLSPGGVTILHLDSQGQIKDALIGRDGSVNHISDMIVAGDYILLGSPYNNYIGRIRRPDAPYQVHIKSVRYEEATPEEKRRDEAAFEEAKAKKAREADLAKKAAEEAASIKKASEEAARKSAAEAQLKKEAEDAAKKAAEKTKARLAAEEAKKRAAEEARAKKEAEEAKARKASEESARRAAEEVKAKKLADEARARKAEELKLKSAAEESAKKKAAAELKAKKATGSSNNDIKE